MPGVVVGCVETGRKRTDLQGLLVDYVGGVDEACVCAASAQHRAAAAAGHAPQSTVAAAAAGYVPQSSASAATAAAGQISQFRASGVTIVDLIGVVVVVYADKLTFPIRGIVLDQGQGPPE